MSSQWSTTPKYILRKRCLDYVMRHWTPASFLEFGSGLGGMTIALIQRGFYGKCYELSEINRELLRTNLSQYTESIQIIDQLSHLQEEKFDYVFAFEVLEHITNDIDALKEWSSHLKTGGRILISVPAHMKHFDRDDEYVGHIRRYEKSEIIEKFSCIGLHDIHVLSYGFPLGNITRKFNRFIYRDTEKDAGESLHSIDATAHSMKSGRERPRVTQCFSFLFNDFFLYPFIVLQRAFFHTDLGDGYIVYAKKGEQRLQKSL